MKLMQPVQVREEMHQQAANPGLPNWLRIWCWAWANADKYGHARVHVGDLRRTLGTERYGTVSEALALAREYGVIDPSSTARCVVLAGHAIAPCEVH